MDHHFFTLVVSNIIQETKDSTTLTLAIPSDLEETFNFDAGQYLTISAKINGEEIRRSYSMSSPSIKNPKSLDITVKKLSKGKMSKYLCETLKIGDELMVMPPEGKFCALLHPDQRIDYYLIGAGSGITPLMSIAQSILEEEPKSTVYLLYGNRKEEDIIFREKITELQKLYDNQFIAQHVLSKSQNNKKSIFGFFKSDSSSNPSFEAWEGRISSKYLDKFFEEHHPRTDQQEYFICGPGEMIETCVAHLNEIGVSNKKIHKEYFATNSNETDLSSKPFPGAKVFAQLEGENYEFIIPAGKTILAAMLEKNIKAPYSCSSGACSTCIAKINSGTVHMDVCHALDEDEIKDGFILTCQSRPTSPEVNISF
jgi:ring-1,2-phenylacetyl-CoA epoxidase subunit PaaE